MKKNRPPEEVLRRVVRLARLNGWSVALVAGLGVLLSLVLLDPIGFAVCGLVGLGGVMEIHGQRMLVRRDAGGMRWLVRAQFVVGAVIVSYAASRILSFDAGYLQQEAIPNLRAMLTSVGMNLDDLLEPLGLDAGTIVPFVRLMVVVLYGSLLLATLVYQGGLALHYRHRTEAVEAALRAPPPLIPPAPPRPPSGPELGAKG